MRNGNADPNYNGVAALLDRLVASGSLPGANVLIYQYGNEVLYHETGLSDVASGKPMARDTLFRLFSMTKPITAAAVMTLADDGVIRLEDAVTDYIPEFADLGVYLGQDGDVVRSTPARPISIGNLLTHTAGFSYWFYPDNPVAALYAKDPRINDERWRFNPALGGHDGLTRSLARLPLVGQPGDKWHYSMSLDVAGIVIERATGEALDEFMKRKIFELLAMDDTAFSVGVG